MRRRIVAQALRVSGRFAAVDRTRCRLACRPEYRPHWLLAGRLPTGGKIPALRANGKEFACRGREHQREIAMKRVAGLVLSLGIAFAPGALRAQDAWPNRPVTLLVPYGP